jgi:hypothetical protein
MGSPIWRRLECWLIPFLGLGVLAASVCRAFETSCRHEVLSFGHHKEVSGREDADELLDWAQETIAATGKPRSTRELRAEVSRRRVTVGEQPSGTNSRHSSSLSFRLYAGNLDGSLRLGALDAQFADGGVDPAWLLPGLAMRRNLRRLFFQLLLRQPHPLRYMVSAFLDRQLCPVQVLSDLPKEFGAEILRVGEADLPVGRCAAVLAALGFYNPGISGI